MSTVLSEPAPAKVQQYSLRDCIDPSWAYKIYTLASLSGFTESELRNAKNNREFSGSGTSDLEEIVGSTFLDWAARNGKLNCVSDRGKATINQKREEARRVANPPPPRLSPEQKTANNAGDLLRQQEQQVQQDRQETSSALIGYYLDLLKLQDARTQADNESLLCLASDLGLSAADVERDQMLVTRALQAEHDYTAGGEASKQRSQADKNYRETLIRHKEELAEARKQCLLASSQTDAASRAYGDLQEFARHKPEFFDTTSKPPRLRRSEPKEEK
jgi:hypothetical protein